MRKSLVTDKHCVAKLLRYINDIQTIILEEEISSYQDLANSLSAKYAVTQLITNIYELSRKLQDETLRSSSSFSKIKTRTARQVASHDYSSVNFQAIFSICTQLSEAAVLNELQSFLNVEDDDNGE